MPLLFKYRLKNEGAKAGRLTKDMLDCYPVLEQDRVIVSGSQYNVV